jgi:acyl-CoA synthetase (AMP-forming)/AMP-acid ligase II
MLRPMRPDRLIRTLGVLGRWGLTPAAAYGVGAIRHPDRPAIVDDLGVLSFRDVQRRTNALASALRATGIREQDAVVVMSHNHRGFVETTVACSKLGANVLYLDTELPPARIAALLRRADPRALVYDEEFAALMPEPSTRCRHFIAWCDSPARAPHPMLEDLIADADDGELPHPPRSSRCVAVLAAGVHGSSQATERKLPSSLVQPAALLTRIPLRRGETTLVAAPLCHPWGFLHLKLALRLGSTVVLQRRFDPHAALDAISLHQASAIALTPEMLQGIVDLGADAIAGHETISLRLIAVSGSSLPQELALPALRSFGDVLHDLYGSSVVKLNGHWLGVDRPVASMPRRTRAAHSRAPVVLANHARRPG